jgi:hypothetical protein
VPAEPPEQLLHTVGDEHPADAGAEHEQAGVL